MYLGEYPCVFLSVGTGAKGTAFTPYTGWASDTIFTATVDTDYNHTDSPLIRCAWATDFNQSGDWDGTAPDNASVVAGRLSIRVNANTAALDAELGLNASVAATFELIGYKTLTIRGNPTSVPISVIQFPVFCLNTQEYTP